MQFGVLNQIMLILLAVTCILAVFSRIRLPSVLGYLCVGILVGPEALNVLSRQSEIEILSEIGIILMMFMVGLEFSWPKLRKNLKGMAGMGSACVAVITAVVMLLAVYLGRLGWGEAFLIGGAVAMSSTALVSKQLAEQQELYASHGRASFNLVLFQDLATLVFLVAIPSLAHTNDKPFLHGLLVSLATMAAVFAGLYFLGRKIEHPLIRLVGALKSNEIFILMTLFIILGAAWISHFFELPVTIGAFLAGMIIGETEFRYKIEEDIRPFRDILMGIFFIGIGMTLKLSMLTDDIPLVLGLLAAVIVIKFLLTAVIVRIGGTDLGNSLRIGLILAHGGEFSLLLVVMGMQQGLIAEEAGQLLLATFVLSLMLSTLLILYNQAVAFFLLSLFGGRGEVTGDIPDDTGCKNLSGHIILCGFGETGRNLYKLLSPSAIPVVVIETDPQKVDSAIKQGARAIYGDAVNLKILKSVNLENARALVITFDNYAQTMKILHKVRSEYLSLPIIVRVHHISHVEDLFLFGATAVLPDGIGASLSLGREIAKSLEIPEGLLPVDQEN